MIFFLTRQCFDSEVTKNIWGNRSSTL